MKRCNHCGQMVDDHCEKCPNCGFRIENSNEEKEEINGMIKCPKCGRYIAKTDEFCGWCEADRRKQNLVENIPKEAQLPEPVPFYQSRCFMWLMLIFLAPVGIFLLWKYTDFPKILKTLLSVGFALIFFLIVMLLCGGFDPVVGEIPGSDSSNASTVPATQELIVIRDSDKEKFLEIGDEKLLNQLYDIGIQTIWKVDIDKEAETIRIIADVTNDIVIQYQDGELQYIYNDTEPREYYYSTDRSYDIRSYRTGSIIQYADATQKAERLQREKGEYQQQSQDYSYSEVERTPSDYVGKKAHFIGTVVQLVDEDDTTLQLRVNVGREEEQILYVEYRKPEDYKERILEDDRIEIYGELDGLERRTNQDQAEEIVPRIIARYIDRIG